MPLNIFVHCASECLTDHEPHGDGLICFSLLNGLAERGHTIHAYAPRVAIGLSSPRLHVRAQAHMVPFNSLAFWEHARRADHWLGELRAQQRIDVVWRMHPYYEACPIPPKTMGLPFVLGPIYYQWPQTEQRAGPRFGIGINGVVRPIGLAGWRRTLHQADHVFCATPGHARAMQLQFPRAPVTDLPVIVDPPAALRGAVRRAPRQGEPVVFAFAANLVANKQPRIFSDSIALLRRSGMPATGLILGDGPERAALEARCRDLGISGSVRFLGKVPNAEVYKVLAQAHLLVSASIGEPYGRSIVEAMSVGTPAICHRSGGPAELIDDGVDGMLVESADPNLYRDRIIELFASERRWDAMSERCSSKATEWSSEKVLDSVEQALNAVCKRAQPYTIPIKEVAA